MAHNTPVSRFVHQFLSPLAHTVQPNGLRRVSCRITEGSAVTGRWDQKLVMPPGVAAEAIAGGMKPGKALKNFTPTRVQALLIKCYGFDISETQQHVQLFQAVLYSKTYGTF